MRVMNFLPYAQSVYTQKSQPKNTLFRAEDASGTEDTASDFLSRLFAAVRKNHPELTTDADVANKAAQYMAAWELLEASEALEERLLKEGHPGDTRLADIFPKGSLH